MIETVRRTQEGVMGTSQAQRQLSAGRVIICRNPRSGLAETSVILKEAPGPGIPTGLCLAPARHVANPPTSLCRALARTLPRLPQTRAQIYVRSRAHTHALTRIRSRARADERGGGQ